MRHWGVPSFPGSLFDADVPEGFQYRGDFISSVEESALADEIARVTFSLFEMRGVVARRRVAFFGGSYDPGGKPTPPIPAFLFPLRERIAEWAGREPDRRYHMKAARPR